jgi:hypothetical protein
VKQGFRATRTFSSKAAARGLVVVDIDALMLEVGVSAVEFGGVDVVLGADHLPEGTTPLQSVAEVSEGRGAREAERVHGWRDR